MKKGLKFYLSFALVGAVTFSTLFLTLNHRFFTSDIYLTTFDDYLDPQIIKDFEEQTHIKVHLDAINTNEEIKAQLLLNPKSYDIIIPSDYMVNNFINNNLVQKIDFSRLDFVKNDHETNGSAFQKQFLTATLYNKLNNYNSKIFDYAIPYFWQFLLTTYNYHDYQINGAIMPPGSKIKNKINARFNNSWNWVQTLDFLITGNPFYSVGQNGKQGNHINIFNSGNHHFQPKLDFNNDLRNLLLIGNNINNVLHNKNINPNPKSDIKPGDIKNMADQSYQNFMDIFSTKDTSNFHIRPIKRMDQTQADDFSYLGNTHVNAMFGYNGDSVSSFLNLGDDNTINKDDYAYISPKVNNLTVDNIVINKSVSGSRLDKVYRFINFLENHEFQNFKFVNYMPVSKTLYDHDFKNYFNGDLLQEQVLKLPINSEKYYIYNDFKNIDSYQELEYIFDSKIDNTNFFESK